SSKHHAVNFFRLLLCNATEFYLSFTFENLLIEFQIIPISRPILIWLWETYYGISKLLLIKISYKYQESFCPILLSLPHLYYCWIIKLIQNYLCFNIIGCIVDILVATVR
ncbi:hypothetical protein PanWU01x14_306130, partial [Parasponia andersonii]